MDLQPLSVSALIGKIKYVLEGEFAQIYVEGEVTNLSSSASGHWYFNLSDGEALVSVALFKMDAFRNPDIRRLKNGDKLQVIGPLSLYAKRGSFQIIAKKIILKGAGDLKEKFELLKRELAAKGLFDLDKKKTIPLLAKKIAIITSPTGAAVRDFINIYQRRSLHMNVMVVGSLMQGEKAASNVIQALDTILAFNHSNPDNQVEVVVLARGGGSIEDLWAFNDEKLAYKIFSYPLPIVSAIGHEVDYTIADFVSDARCETPSSAAEMLTSYQVEIMSKMTNFKLRLKQGVHYLLERKWRELERLGPRSIIDKLWEKIHFYNSRLQKISFVSRGKDFIRFHEYMQRTDEAISSISHCMEKKLMDYHSKLKHFSGVLKALDPSRVLERGYSIVKAAEDNVICNFASYNQLLPGQTIELTFYDGKGLAIKSKQGKQGDVK